jgi:hypothetical protein
VIALQVTRFFYRRCITISNPVFCDQAVEGLTKIFFEANCGLVFNMIVWLNKAQNAGKLTRLQNNMSKYSELKLKDLKVDLAFEEFKVGADCDSSFDSNCPRVDFRQEVNYTLYS